MPIRKRGETWWIDIQHNGRRIRKSADTPVRAEAQRMHDEIRAELWKSKPQGHTLAEALKLWLTASTRSRNDKNAIKLLLSIYPSRPLEEITGHDIYDALASKGPAWANRIANIIRATLKLALDRGWIEKQPIIKKRDEPKTRTEFLTWEQSIRLLAELPHHLAMMAAFSLATGLRQSNVTGLTWAQVDMKRKIAWVHADEAKAGKIIHIPLSSTALQILQDQTGEHETHVFAYNGEPIAGQLSTKAWRNARERAGLGNFRWHGLRHTWASWHVQNGTPLPVLKELGGWESMDMVMRYAHLAPSHISAWAGNAGKQEESNLNRHKLRHNKKTLSS